MPLTINTDGGSRARHSHGKSTGAAWAFVVHHPTHGRFGFTGLMDDPQNATNNEAEYEAVIQALNWMNERQWYGQVLIKSDSELVVKQLNGEYAVKNEKLMPYWMLALAALEELRTKVASVTLMHIPRAENIGPGSADELCNKTMDAYEASLRGNNEAQ